MTTVATGPRGGLPPTTIGGVGTREFTGGTIKGAVLQVGGILYVTAPDNVWALDALDGREIWHYFWKTRGATHIGNRGAAIWYDSLLVRDTRQLPRLARCENRQRTMVRRNR